MTKIHKIITGGQTGVDRAALDAAIECRLSYGGWCPKGGWAEDYQIPPGLMTVYPKLIETPSPEPEQRTEWNVRDSSATLILLNSKQINISEGTKLTRRIAEVLNKPLLITTIKSSDSLAAVQKWILELDKDVYLNFAGARESESPGIYSQSKDFILRIIKSINN